MNPLINIIAIIFLSAFIVPLYVIYALFMEIFKTVLYLFRKGGGAK